MTRDPYTRALTPWLCGILVHCGLKKLCLITMLNLVIFGAPGSGKGTQSEKLIDRYHLHHISTGEVLRDHIARGTELGRTADGYISQGQLIPDDLMLRVLEHELDANADKAKDGVIFDGFPRTIPQAKALKQMMERRGQKIHAVVGLEVPEDQLMERMVLRGKASGRSDDNPETIRKRLAVYHKQTQPLRDYYTDEGKYLAIQGDGTVDEVFERVIAALGDNK